MKKNLLDEMILFENKTFCFNKYIYKSQCQNVFAVLPVRFTVLPDTSGLKKDDVDPKRDVSVGAP